ncbi:MAG: tetratricopeptide repeat-containing sensor histidine kinase [Candidatus Cloacimonetes bacterium]|nr:tetratricopeptide repeat-containing sensor histidine kinase [Candidatus Cloacimonadota bacterium]
MISIETLEKQLTEYKKDNEEKLEILNKLTFSYFDVSLEKAMNYGEIALKLSKKSNNQKNVADTLANIGVIHDLRKNYEKALEYYFKSLNIRKEIGDIHEIATSYENIAILYLKLQNYKKSTEYLNNSYKLAKEINDIYLIKNYYKILSDIHFIQNNYKKAFKYYKLFSETKDAIFNEESNKKVAETQTKYETNRKEKEKEIYKLKNIELAKANEVIKNKNKELEIHREHLNLINKILRHDLTNNFAVIHSAVRLFKDLKDEQYLIEINKSVHKSVELIQNMKDLKNFINSHQNLKLYYLNDILNKIIIDYPDIDFNIIGEGKVLADEKLNSVFENIIKNAIIHGNADRIDINIKNNEKKCEVEIADNGIGIPSKMHNKIFNEGFKYGEKGHIGLGLFIVKKAMESFEGIVSIKDNKPNGAVFVLTFRKVG